MEWKLLLLLSAFALCFTIVSCVSEQGKLKTELLADYDPSSPPSPKANETIKVTLSLDLQQIIKLDEKQNSISLVTRMKMEFVDNRLEFAGRSDDISKLRIPFGKLWLPDIMLYNRLSGAQFSSKKVNALVYSTGYVIAVAPMQLTASCEFDLTFFPYDTQECKLVFGSWSTDKSVMELAITSDTLNLDNFSRHPEWKLQNVTFKLNEKTYPSDPGHIYQDATATLALKRQSTPYAVKLVIPSVLTAFLILFTFILPSSSGEKIVFCLILLLCLLLLSVYLHISVPTNTESVLGEFLTFALFLDFFATIIAVICYNVADALLMRDKLGGPESEKHWASRKRKLKILRITEWVFFLVFLIIFIIGAAVILCRRG